MAALPAESLNRTPPPAGAQASPAIAPLPAGPSPRLRLAGAWTAIAATLVTLVALILPYAAPRLALVLVPALVLLLAALAFAAATTVERRRQAAARERLAAENRRLSAALERAADAAWELHESEERAARRRAEAADAAKSRLLATVSHEFRTPLNGILGLTGLLLETGLAPDQETYVRGAHASGQALLALVDDMLDYARSEAGRFELRPSATALEGLLEEVVELLAPRAFAKGIGIAARVGDGVPPVVAVDAARLRQVLLNLAGNGVKFTETGGVGVTARRLPAAGADRAVRIELAVADSGPGIAAADAERIFGEFEQVDSPAARRQGGAGLGLAISRRIVRQMGSDITVGARPGGGAVFRFVLDLPEAAPDAPREDAGALPDLAGRRLMIVAPAAAVETALLAECLAAAGASVRVVANGTDAAALAGAAAAAALPYEAALVDARIAPQPGESLALIREAAGMRLPALVLIEPDQRGDRERLRGAGFDGYLVRPVRRSSLIRVTAAILSPAGDAAFRPDPADIRPPRARIAAGTEPGLAVLVAEDNEINALLVRAVAERLGHTVTEARDGLAAVAAATASGARYAVILLDLHMPRLDGLAAARLIRAHEAKSGARRARIVALTADETPASRVAAAAAGIDAVLAKPASPESLRRALADLAA